MSNFDWNRILNICCIYMFQTDIFDISDICRNKSWKQQLSVKSLPSGIDQPDREPSVTFTDLYDAKRWFTYVESNKRIQAALHETRVNMSKTDLRLKYFAIISLIRGK